MNLEKEQLKMLKDERNDLQTWVDSVKGLITTKEEKIKVFNSIIKKGK